jgi:hypothetical protein
MMKMMLLAGISLLFILPRTEPNAASVGGYVTDENQAPIAGAAVSIRNVFSGQVNVTNSDRTGSYNLTGRKQGRYSAFAKAEGYGSVWVFNIILSSGEHQQLDFVLARERQHEDLLPAPEGSTR